MYHRIINGGKAMSSTTHLGMIYKIYTTYKNGEIGDANYCFTNIIGMSGMLWVLRVVCTRSYTHMYIYIYMYICAKVGL